jgi:hypothetical protein
MRCIPFVDRGAIVEHCQPVKNLLQLIARRQRQVHEDPPLFADPTASPTTAAKPLLAKPDPASARLGAGIAKPLDKQWLHCGRLGSLRIAWSVS